MPQPHLEDESSAPKRYERRVIRPEMTVRQVSADFPACRAVFAAHGEMERAGVAFGHCQTLGDFARTRGLVFDDLLDELSTAAGVAVDRWSHGAEEIHRLFLLAALLITLTLGAGWGAWLLWEIGQARAFPAAPPSHIVAHGEMQLWGFVGLFITGISLRTVLRDAVRTRARQWICRGMLSVVLLALVGGFGWSLWPDRFPNLGWIGGTWLLWASTLLWGVQIGCLAGKWRMTWARAVMTSGLWLTVWAAITCWLRWQAGEAGPAVYLMRERLIVIELAVFGFALNSIYGFGQMLLPGLLGLGKTRAWALESAYWCHNLGVMVLALVGFGGLPGSATPVGVSSILAGTILFATGQRGFLGKRPRTRGLEKGHHLLDAYIPLAFFWLLTSMLLLAGVSIREAYFGVETSHAIAGGIRHALTVGFMTTLILGVGQRIVPVLEHAIPTLPMLVAPILLLIGLGNGLRVVTEFGTLWLAGAFWVMPFSALLEWGALLLFGVSMVTQMFRRDPFPRDGRVRPTSSLARVLSSAPRLEDRLIAESSGYLARVRSVPQELTVAAFARREQREPEEFARYLGGLLAEENRLAADPVGDPETRAKTTATPKSH